MHPLESEMQVCGRSLMVRDHGALVDLAPLVPLRGSSAAANSTRCLSSTEHTNITPFPCPPTGLATFGHPKDR